MDAVDVALDQSGVVLAANRNSQPEGYSYVNLAMSKTVGRVVTHLPQTRGSAEPDLFGIGVTA
jgi:hypothetical protein